MEVRVCLQGRRPVQRRFQWRENAFGRASTIILLCPVSSANISKMVEQLSAHGQAEAGNTNRLRLRCSSSLAAITVMRGAKSFRSELTRTQWSQ